MKALNMGSELTDSTTTFSYLKNPSAANILAKGFKRYQRRFHCCECVQAVIVQQGLQDVCIDQDSERCKAANLWVEFAYRAETKKRWTFTA
jgi:hypothetical protein